MTTIEDFLVRLANRGHQVMDDRHGWMPAGQNGPHGDPETPVRNTGHWLCLFAYAHARTGAEDLRIATERALNYLLSREARPMGHTFHHRENPRKDACNGLIGQAWTIEALLAGYRALGDERAVRTAVEVANLHPFSDDLGLWEAVDVSGTIVGFDVTFNHQLWFGIQLLELALESGSVDILHQCDRFLELLPTHLRTSRDGRVTHHVLSPVGQGRAIPRLRAAHRRLTRLRAGEQMKRRELGYQTFNLYAFARLHRLRPEAGILNDPALDRAVRLVFDPSFKDKVATSQYGFEYNAPGFEIPLVVEEFGAGSPMMDVRQTARWWFETQCDRTFDPETFTFSRGTPDGTTLTARAYELCRFRAADSVAIDDSLLAPT